MSMPGIWELLALAVLALLVFGPDRLPGVLRSFGRAVGTVRREARSALDELKASGDFEELQGAARELRDEADSLRNQGRAMTQEPQRAKPDRAAGRERTSPAVGAAPPANEPAPFDPDTP